MNTFNSQHKITKKYLKTFILSLLFISIFINKPLIDTFVLIRTFDIFILLLTVIYLLILFKKRKVNLVKDNIYILFILFITWIFLSSLLNGNILLGLKGIAQYLEFFLFIILFNFYFGNIELEKIFILFKYITILISIIYIFRNIYNGNIIGMKSSSNKILPALASSLIFSDILFKRNKAKNVMIFILFIFFTILTLERKSWIALFCSILFQYILYNKYFVLRKINFKITKANFIVIIITFLVILLTLGLFYTNPVIHNQLESLMSLFLNDNSPQTASNRERLKLLKNSVKIFKNNFILGIGIDNFSDHYANLSKSFRKVGAHNEFITIGTELGIVGLILYVLLWLNTLKSLNLMIKYKYVISSKSKQNIIKILGLWMYGLIIVFFKAAGYINILLLVLPINFSLIFLKSFNKKVYMR